MTNLRQATQIPGISPFPCNNAPTTEKDHPDSTLLRDPGETGWQFGDRKLYRQLRAAGAGSLQKSGNTHCFDFLSCRVFFLEGFLSASRWAGEKGIGDQPQHRGCLGGPTPPAGSASQENFHKQLHQDGSVNLDQSLLSPVTFIMTLLHLPLPLRT